MKTSLGPVFRCTNTEKGLFSRHNFLMVWYLNVSLKDLPVLSTNHLNYMLCSHAQLNKGSNSIYFFPLKALVKSVAKVTCQYCYTLTSDNTFHTTNVLQITQCHICTQPSHSCLYLPRPPCVDPPTVSGFL